MNESRVIEHELKENSFPPFFCLSLSLSSFLSLSLIHFHHVFLSTFLPFFDSHSSLSRIDVSLFVVIGLRRSLTTRKTFNYHLSLSLSLLTSCDMYWNERERERRNKGRKETKPSSSLSCSFNKQHQTFQGSTSFQSNFPISIQIYLLSSFLFLFLSFFLSLSLSLLDESLFSILNKRRVLSGIR